MTVVLIVALIKFDTTNNCFGNGDTANNCSANSGTVNNCFDNRGTANIFFPSTTINYLANFVPLIHNGHANCGTVNDYFVISSIDKYVTACGNATKNGTDNDYFLISGIDNCGTACDNAANIRTAANG